MARQTRLDEIVEYLIANCDPDTVVELLNITTEELVERFRDKLQSRSSYVCRELEIMDSSTPDEDTEENERDYD